MVAITGKEIRPPAATAIRSTSAAISDSRIPGRAMRMAAVCMATEVATAFSISTISSSVLYARWSITARMKSTEAFSASAVRGRPSRPGEQDRVVGPVGRQVADRPARGDCRLHDLGQRRPRPGVGDTDPFGAFGDGGQVAHPHDVVDGQLVAEDDGRALVDVDHRRQLGLVETEVVEEGAVLPEGVAVVGVVHRALGVAEEQQQTVVKTTPQTPRGALHTSCVKTSRGSSHSWNGTRRLYPAPYSGHSLFNTKTQSPTRRHEGNFAGPDQGHLGW